MKHLVIPKIDLICMIFGRTDLRIGLSGAKFREQSDFEVRLAVAPQKPSKKDKKLIFRSNKFTLCFFFRRRKMNVGNRLKRVFLKFHANQSHV